jgi:hypothetical protein
MLFKTRFHEPIRRGEITCSIRIWKRPHVKVGNRYRLGTGEIQVDRVSEISIDEITPALARRSGFHSVVELLKTARHGYGERVFIIELHYVGEREDNVVGAVGTNDEAMAQIARRLDAMDVRSRSGTSTRTLLRMIEAYPGRRAAELARELGQTRDELKRDVRKLKRLGLTHSLDVGYRLSELGEGLLARERSG